MMAMDPKPPSLSGEKEMSRSVIVESSSASTNNDRNDQQSHDEHEVELVYFKDHDPDDPKNWSDARKVRTTLILCSLAFCGVFGSSSYAPGEPQVMKMFNVNAETASTGLTVYVLGFAFGPLICPMSELLGRKLPYMISWPLLVAFVIPSAFVDNIVVIMIFRFLSGVCSSCTITNGGGVISDMWSTEPRKLAYAIGWYSFCPLSGPIAGSLVGFFVAAHLTHGLWVIRVHLFFAAALLPLPFILPETHGPTILTKRAKRLRANGKTNAYAAHELHKYTFRELVKKHVGRPLAMLFREPIVQGAAIWITLGYGLIYIFFEVYPFVFIQQKGIPYQLGGLPFIGITLGMLLCTTTMDAATQLSGKVRIPFIDPPGTGTPVTAPEAGLKAVLPACILTPISLFWFAWTSQADVHWIWATLAGIPFGYSMLCVFNAFTIYSSKTYIIFASSALAANTFARSIVASVLPVVAHPLLNNIGSQWGVSIFAFCSLGLLPIPLIFVRYGPQLRERSHFARESRELIAGTRNQAAQAGAGAKQTVAETENEKQQLQPPHHMIDLERGDGARASSNNLSVDEDHEHANGSRSFIEKDASENV